MSAPDSAHDENDNDFAGGAEAGSGDVGAEEGPEKGGGSMSKVTMKGGGTLTVSSTGERLMIGRLPYHGEVLTQLFLVTIVLP